MTPKEKKLSDQLKLGTKEELETVILSVYKRMNHFHDISRSPLADEIYYQTMRFIEKITSNLGGKNEEAEKAPASVIKAKLKPVPISRSLDQATYLKIQEGDPTINGMYVAYVHPDVTIPYAKKEFLIWIDNRWGYCGSDQWYRGKVYGWIGPLPALKFNPGE